MLARINLRKIVAASVLALVVVVGSLGTAGSALAGGCGGYGGGYGGYGGYGAGYGGHCHAPVCAPRYTPVVTYRYEQVPYTVCVTRYDHCGNAYHVDEVHYRTVQVPVVSTVRYGY